MGWIHDEIGRAVGLPAVLGGSRWDGIGATGLGLAACAEAVQEAGCLRLEGARVAVQGFGAVGANAARFLVERGAVLVAASDSAGAVTNPQGLEVVALGAWKAEGHTVGAFGGGEPIPRDELVGWTATCWSRPPGLMGWMPAMSSWCGPRWCWRAPTCRPRWRPSSGCTSAGSWSCPTSSPTPAG
jgi:glutamate dehydrogenase (NAD(P)+)